MGILVSKCPVPAPVAMGQRARERVVPAVSSKGSGAKWLDLDLKFYWWLSVSEIVGRLLCISKKRT